MWSLTNKKTDRVYFLVPQQAGHTVGRVNTDLVIQNDDSISRQHAMLQPSKDALKLTDTGSRYGTYVNGNIAKVIPISKEHATGLNVGDTVQFGRCGSIWTVGRINFRCLTSTLTMTNELKEVLKKLGAELLATFDAGVSHLIMPTITVTTKLLSCLVGQVPVVTPEYFAAADACIAQGKTLPAVTDYTPECIERGLRNTPKDFQPNAVRRGLFQGKEFIFFTNAHYMQYESIIKLAGGSCLCAARVKIHKTRFVQPHVVTIKLRECEPSQSQSQSLDSLDKQFTERRLRMIPDMEIGLAILYCSTEKYCNPTYHFASNVEVRPGPGPIETEDILAKNSMNSENTHLQKKVKYELHTIPETEPNTVQSERATTSSTSVEVTHPSSPVLNSLAVPGSKKRSASNEPPPGPRRSKRLTEIESHVKQPPNEESEKDSFQEPKRPRRAAPVSPIKRISTAFKPNNVPKRDTPVESEPNTVSPVATEPNTVSRPVSASHSGSAQVVQGGQGTELQEVTRNRPSEASLGTNTALDSRRPTSRRRAYVLDDEDELFNFEGIEPRKKTRTTGPSVANVSPATTVNQTPVSSKQRSSIDDVHDLFSFDENLPFQRRRGTNRLTTSTARPPATKGNSTDTPSSSASAGQNSDKGNNSLSSRNLEFMKPIELSTTGWLSSAMCNLKVESNDEDQASSLKIKQEPSDSVDGMAGEDKRWVSEISNIFQVQEKSMNLAVHVSPSRERTAANAAACAFPGVRNFKAFIKKRNYHAEQTNLVLKLVCALDESQAA